MLWEVFQLKSLYGLRWPKWCGGDTCTRWVTIYSIYTTELIWNCNTSTRGQCWVLRLCPGCCQFLRQKHNQPWLRNSWYSSYSEKGPYKGSPGDGSSLSGHDMLYISRWMDIFSSWLQLLLFFFCSFLLGFFLVACRSYQHMNLSVHHLLFSDFLTWSLLHHSDTEALPQVFDQTDVIMTCTGITGKYCSWGNIHRIQYYTLYFKANFKRHHVYFIPFIEQKHSKNSTLSAHYACNFPSGYTFFSFLRIFEPMDYAKARYCSFPLDVF